MKKQHIWVETTSQTTSELFSLYKQNSFEKLETSGAYITKI